MGLFYLNPRGPVMCIGKIHHARDLTATISHCREKKQTRFRDQVHLWHVPPRIGENGPERVGSYMGQQYQEPGTAKQTAASFNSRDAEGDFGLVREQLSWVENPEPRRKLRKM